MNEICGHIGQPFIKGVTCLIQTVENSWFILIVISILIIAIVSFLNIVVKKLYYAVHSVDISNLSGILQGLCFI